MQVEVFSIMDVKIGVFAQPFFSQTRASGMRAFFQACQDSSTMLGQYPHDFQLYHLGTFEDGDGIFTCNKPALLATGAQELKA
ncbi:MAG: nonstructural protein [Microvirus sp.]|nr:MAG: nonstructural protein [Microvirus sp.]